MKCKFWTGLVMVWMVLLMLCACSEPDWLQEDLAHHQPVQMGGSIQGNPINLAASVLIKAGLAGTSGSADGVGSSALFNSPQGITTDGANLYVADTANNTIRQITISTGAVTTLAGTPGSSGSADGVGSSALFNSPQGITTDGTSLFVSDTANNTIRQIVISTGSVTTFAGTAGSSGSVDGVGPTALFNAPQGITTDGTFLYVTDTGNHTIRQISIYNGVAPQMTGQIARKVGTLAGTAGSSGSTDGTGPAALFNTPQGITTDGANLYIADTSNNTIRVIVISTGAVTTIAGTAGSSGSTDGTGSAALFKSPEGITTDGTYLYATDTGNNTIRKITISSTEAVTVATIAGTAGSSGSTSGTGAAALFNSPEGITTDGINLYVTDTDNNTIRQIQ